MRITTLSIGDELISGRVRDTNAGDIASQLLTRGLRVQRHMVVGDSEPDIIGALTELSRMADAVIVTGGLGPTADDLTAHAAARATGRRLVVNEEAKAHVRQICSTMDALVVCTLNDKQAMIPTKSVLIPNPNGTACGFHLMHNGSFLFFMPGVPDEMRPMLAASVIPFLLERTTHRQAIQTRHVNLFGLSEAEADERLQGVARPDQGVVLGMCVTFPWIRVTVSCAADSPDTSVERVEQAVATVRERLQEYVFSDGEAGMDEAVAGLLAASGLTLALAESCTGGMIAQRITSVAGSSAYFLQGLVTYSNQAKERLLGVPAQILETSGAVSSECASAMAKGVRREAGSALGLAVTGIAGPDGGSDEKPVGTVFISLAASDGCWTKRFQFRGSREQIRIMTTWTSLDWLRRYLGDRTS